LSRIPENAEMGELLLNEEYLVIPFRYKEERDVKDIIAWDCNERSLDGFNPKLGWVRVDLTELFHIHRVYELKRQRLQEKASKKPSLRRVLAKYSRREGNRARDFIHKLTTFLSREYEGYIHGFEDLEKKRMFNGSKKHNREVAKSDWKTIQSFMAYKSKTMTLNPKNTSKRCSRCGMINAPKGAKYECKGCGLRIDRQLNAAINLYMRAKGIEPSPETFRELTKNIKDYQEPNRTIDVKL
ncbi:MAG: transposase, partial [Nitrososphaerota archaeon]